MVQFMSERTNKKCKIKFSLLKIEKTLLYIVITFAIN